MARAKKAKSRKRNAPTVKKAAKKTGRALKGAAQSILTTGASLLESGAMALNPFDPVAYKRLMSEGRKLEKEAEKLNKQAGIAYQKVFNSPQGSPEAKKWNAEWKRLEAEALVLRKAANKLYDKAEAMKREQRGLNPKRKNKTIIKARTIKHLDVSKVHNPRKRLKVRNKYIDLVIKGNAKKTPQGWSIGGKVYTQGKGTVKLSSGYYLDKATGFVYAKRERNVSEGFYDSGGTFHPIRSSADYDPSLAGESGGKAKRTRSAKRKASKSRASKTARHRASVKSVKSTRSRLAGRSLARTTSTGKRLKRRNVEQGFYDEYGFHPIRASADYSEGRRPSRSRRAKAMKRKAASTHGTRSRVRSRKATASRLAGRSLKKSAGMLGRRKNVSPDAIRKDFAGRVGKGAELYFPEGTPTGLAKLGKLVSITTEEGTLKPTNGTAWLVCDTKGKLHIGSTSNKPLWDGSAHSFGSVKQVEYEEAKPHLGFPNPIVFYHKLGEENGVKPKLYADGKGGLKFKGGAYRITREGIVN